MADRNGLSWKRWAAGGVVLVAAAAAAHAPSLWASFIWDDREFLWENPLTLSDNGIVEFWMTTETPDYLPLTSGAFWVQWRLWGRDPLGYHAVNLALHALSAVLIWLTLRRLRVPGSWLAAALFTVHPVTVATIAWAAELKNTLSLPLFLAAVLSFLRWESVGRARWYALCVVLFVLAMLSKSSVVVLPTVLLLCVWWRRGRVARRPVLSLAPLFALSAIFSYIAVWYQYNRAIRGNPIGGPEGLVERLALAGRTFWFYLYKALLPLNLSMIYPRWDVHRFSVWGPLGLAGMVLAAGLILRYRKSWGRAVGFGLGYYLVTLLPVLGFFDMSFMVHSFVADHLQYLALLGPIALVCGLCWHAVRKRSPTQRRLGIMAAAVAVVGLGALSFRQGRFYSDPVTFWNRVVEKNPESWAAHNNLGRDLYAAGWPEEALVHFQEATRLRPTHAEVFNNMGVVHASAGRLTEAEECYRKAVQLRPNYGKAHQGLAKTLARLKQFDEAAEHFRTAMQLRPFDRAVVADAHFGLGVYAARYGEFRDAVEHYRLAIQANPGKTEAMNNMAWILATSPDEGLRNGPEAVRLAEQCCEETAYGRMQYVLTLATAYAEAGEFPAGVATVERAVALVRDDERTTKMLLRLADDFRRGEPYRTSVAASADEEQ